MCSMWLPTVRADVSSADLLVRHATHEQSQHLDLAGGQAGDRLGRRGSGARRRQDGVDRIRIEAAGSASASIAARARAGSARRGAGGPHAGLVDLGGGQHRARGYGGAGQAAGVARSVHPLVEHARDRADLGQLGWWPSTRSVRYGTVRTRSHSSATADRLPVPVDTPIAPRRHTSAAACASSISAGGIPARRAARAASAATAARMADEPRRLQVGVVGERLECALRARRRP